MNRAPRKEPAFVCRYTKVDTAAECHCLEIGEQELENLLFEIISKQAQIILNTDNINDVRALDLRIMEQVEYEKQIEKCNDGKCDLYERYLLKEIDATQFKVLKADIDVELNRLAHASAVVSSQVDKMRMDSETKAKTREVAERVSKETGLTKALADLLIDKVYVYPNNHIKILWKVTGFSNE